MKSSGRCPTAITSPTIRAGGPTNTGGVGARYGIVVTKGGLVFHAGNDGKVRAYDEDTRRSAVDRRLQRHHQRRSGQLRIQGRQYFVIVSSEGGAADVAVAGTRGRRGGAGQSVCTDGRDRVRVAGEEISRGSQLAVRGARDGAAIGYWLLANRRGVE